MRKQTVITCIVGRMERENGTVLRQTRWKNLERREEQLRVNEYEGIRSEAVNTTVNDIYRLWCNMKRGLKDNTFQNYKYMYEMFVAPDLGQMKVQNLKKSDVRRFYNRLVEERGLKINTTDGIHTVLHQVLEVAVEDGYLRTNISDNVLKELKQSHNMGDTHKRALTIPEQKLFEDYLDEDTQYSHWKPIFTVMLGTGMRVGEVTVFVGVILIWKRASSM